MATLLVEIDGTRAKQQARDLQEALRKLGMEANVTQKNVGGMGDALGTAARRMLTFVASTYGLTQSVRLISDFGHSMSAVAAVTKANASQMAQLTAQARELGATTQFTASQAGDAMEVLGRAGLKTQQILAAMPTALDLAAAASMELRQAADITAKTMAAFQLPAAQAQQVADVFAVAAANANTNVEGMGEAMRYAGPAAKAFGYTVAETAAAMGVLSDAGLQGSMAGTGLRRVLSELASPTKKAAETLEAMGISLEKVNPAENSLIEIVAELKDKHLDAAQAFTIFGDRGAAAALNLALMHDRLVELTGITMKSEGEARRMATTVQDNLWGSIKRLKSAAEEMILVLDDGMNGSLREVVDSLTDLILAMRDGSQVLGTVFGGALKSLSVILGFLAENTWLVEAAMVALVATKVAGWATSAAQGVALLNVNLGATATAFAGLAAPIAAVGAIIIHAVNQWRDETTQAIEDIVRTSARGQEALALLKKDAEDVRQADVDTASGIGTELRAERDRLRKQIERMQADVVTTTSNTAGTVTALRDPEGLREARENLAAVEKQIERVDSAAMELATRYSAVGKAAEQAAEDERKALDEVAEAERRKQIAANEAEAAAEAARKEAEQYAQAIRDTVDELDPWGARVRDAAVKMAMLEDAMRSGEFSASTLARALKTLGDELDYLREGRGPGEFEVDMSPTDARVLAQATEEMKESALLARAAVDAMGDEWLEANDAATSHELRVRQLEQSVIETGYAIADAFSGTQFGEAIAGLTKIYESVIAIRDATTQAQMAQGWAGLAQGVGQAGRAAGWWGPKGGQGTFGPKEGNYATEGAAIGMIVGAIIGTIVPVIGTAVGAAVGGVLGEIIGSAIKHGAPEAKAEIRMEADRFVTDVYRDEGGLGDIVSEIGQKIIDDLDQVLAALGAEIESLPTVKLKVRGDHVSVVVGAMYAKFKSVDEAISFAITQIMRQGEISGNLSDNVKAALQNTLAGSFEELLSDIDFAMQLDRVDMGPVEVAISDFLVEYRAAVERATQLGLDTSQVGRMLGKNLQGLRDQILGVEIDPKEKIKRDAAMFNAEILLMRAEQTARLAELQQKRAALVADMGILGVEGKVMRERLSLRMSMVQAEAKLVDAESTIVGGMLQSLAAIDAAIAASSALLENLPDLISEGEIAAAMRRVGGGRGDEAPTQSDRVRSDREARRTAALERIRDLQEELVQGQLSPLTGRQKVAAAQAEYERIKAGLEANPRNVALLEQIPDALRTYLESFQTAYGSTGAYEQLFNREYEFLSQILRDNGRRPYGEQQPTNDSMERVMRESFKRDARGRLETHDPEIELSLQLGNSYAERTARDVERMANAIEDMNLAASRAAASAPATRPAPPPSPVPGAG